MLAVGVESRGWIDGGKVPDADRGEKKFCFSQNLACPFGYSRFPWRWNQVLQGRRLGPEELALVGYWLATEPTWNRTRLSRELCRRWNWRNEAGRLKDMACRTLLLKLERQGMIRLPVRQGPSPNAFRNRKRIEVTHDQNPITGELSRLRPLRIEALGERHPDLALFRFLLQRYHYLGLRNGVGENLKYMARDRQGASVGLSSVRIGRLESEGP